MLTLPEALDDRFIERLEQTEAPIMLHRSNDLSECCTARLATTLRTWRALRVGRILSGRRRSAGRRSKGATV